MRDNYLQVEAMKQNYIIVILYKIDYLHNTIYSIR